jgi:flagellar basal-body rod protein FlgG
VTKDGFTVVPGVSVPQDAVGVSINRQGVVQAIMADGSAPQEVGALELARFVNPAGLDAIGGNSFLETPASGAANRGLPGSVGFGTVQQGFLETSNVNAVTEISALITAQRAYEMNSKVITTTDEMLRSTSNLR